MENVFTLRIYKMHTGYQFNDGVEPAAGSCGLINVLDVEINANSNRFMNLHICFGLLAIFSEISLPIQPLPAREKQNGTTGNRGLNKRRVYHLSLPPSIPLSLLSPTGSVENMLI